MVGVVTDILIPSLVVEDTPDEPPVPVGAIHCIGHNPTAAAKVGTVSIYTVCPAVIASQVGIEESNNAEGTTSITGVPDFGL